jgi:hypothetical protein
MQAMNQDGREADEMERVRARLENLRNQMEQPRAHARRIEEQIIERLNEIPSDTEEEEQEEEEEEYDQPQAIPAREYQERRYGRFREMRLDHPDDFYESDEDRGVWRRDRPFAMEQHVEREEEVQVNEPILVEPVLPPQEQQQINGDAPLDMGDEAIGILEAIGFRGNPWMMVQNSALLSLVMCVCLGVAVWVPYVVGRCVILVNHSFVQNEAIYSFLLFRFVLLHLFKHLFI